jgi:N-acetylmuramate 1-kinase
MLDKKIKSWVTEKLAWPVVDIEAVSGDASFRQYFRISHAGESRILMLSPPDKEDPNSFVNIAQQWHAIGLQVPEIYAVDWEQGFLLISDLGDCLYSRALNEQTADLLYQDALLAIIRLQKQEAFRQQAYPVFDKVFMWKEIGYFTEWFMPYCLGAQLSEQETVLWMGEINQLLNEILAQPQVVVHRDYHSRNLLVRKQNNPGIIDFQDAVIGPLMYDPVSLLKDAYIAWPAERIEQWIRFFWSNSGCSVSFDMAERWFDMTSLQRHIKVLGIFARLAYRDNKKQYLNDMPRVAAYISETLQDYPKFPMLQKLFFEQVQPKMHQMQEGDLCAR